jgi:hypothetical protein
MVSSLIDRLKKNRAEHRKIFEEALVGYRNRVIEELDRRLKDAKAGRKIDTRIYLTEPEDHTREYDRAIDMLEMHTEPEIELTREEFVRLARDEWEWMDQFIATSSTYR